MANISGSKWKQKNRVNVDTALYNYGESDQYVTIPWKDLYANQEFTISLFFQNFDNTATSSETLISNINFGDWTSPGNLNSRIGWIMGFEFYNHAFTTIMGDGSIGYEFKYSLDNGATTSNSEKLPLTHAAITVDASYFSLYINGRLQGQQLHEFVDPTYYENNPIYIGYGGLNRSYTGYSNNFMMFNRALTEDELRYISVNGGVVPGSAHDRIISHHPLQSAQTYVDLNDIFDSSLYAWYDWTRPDSSTRTDYGPNALHLDASIHGNDVPPVLQVTSGKQSIAPVASTARLAVDVSTAGHAIEDTISFIVIGDIFTNTASNNGGIFYSFDDYSNGGWGFNCGYSANDWSVGSCTSTNNRVTIPVWKDIALADSTPTCAINVHGPLSASEGIKTYSNLTEASIAYTDGALTDTTFRPIQKINIFGRDDTDVDTAVHEMYEMIIVHGDVTQHPNYNLFVNGYLRKKYPQINWEEIPGTDADMLLSETNIYTSDSVTQYNYAKNITDHDVADMSATQNCTNDGGGVYTSDTNPGTVMQFYENQNPGRFNKIRVSLTIDASFDGDVDMTFNETVYLGLGTLATFDGTIIGTPQEFVIDIPPDKTNKFARWTFTAGGTTANGQVTLNHLIFDDTLESNNGTLINYTDDELGLSLLDSSTSYVFKDFYTKNEYNPIVWSQKDSSNHQFGYRFVTDQPAHFTDASSCSFVYYGTWPENNFSYSGAGNVMWCFISPTADFSLRSSALYRVRISGATGPPSGLMDLALPDLSLQPDKNIGKPFLFSWSYNSDVSTWHSRMHWFWNGTTYEASGNLTSFDSFGAKVFTQGSAPTSGRSPSGPIRLIARDTIITEENWENYKNLDFSGDSSIYFHMDFKVEDASGKISDRGPNNFEFGRFNVDSGYNIEYYPKPELFKDSTSLMSPRIKALRVQGNTKYLQYTGFQIPGGVAHTVVAVWALNTNRDFGNSPPDFNDTYEIFWRHKTGITRLVGKNNHGLFYGSPTFTPDNYGPYSNNYDYSKPWMTVQTPYNGVYSSCFMNGGNNELQEGTTSENFPFSTSADLLIGNDGALNPYTGTNGYCMYFAIFEGTLSRKDIEVLWNNGLLKNPSIELINKHPLQMFIDFNNPYDDAGTLKFPDLSENGFDITAIGYTDLATLQSNLVDINSLR